MVQVDPEILEEIIKREKKKAKRFENLSLVVMYLGCIVFLALEIPFPYVLSLYFLFVPLGIGVACYGYSRLCSRNLYFLIDMSFEIVIPEKKNHETYRLEQIEKIKRTMKELKKEKKLKWRNQNK